MKSGGTSLTEISNEDASASSKRFSFLELIESLRKETAPVGRLMERLLSRTGYEAYLTKSFPDAPRRMSRIMQLVGIAGRFDQDQEGSLPEFLLQAGLFAAGGDLLPYARKMFEGVREGCRDVAAFRLAIHLKSKGCRMEQAERLLQEWNEKNQPPLSSREVTMKVRSAYLHGYRGYGCEDPLIIPFCDEACPIKQIRAKRKVNQWSAMNEPPDKPRFELRHTRVSRYLRRNCSPI